MLALSGWREIRALDKETHTNTNFIESVGERRLANGRRRMRGGRYRWQRRRPTRRDDLLLARDVAAQFGQVLLDALFARNLLFQLVFGAVDAAAQLRNRFDQALGGVLEAQLRVWVVGWASVLVGVVLGKEHYLDLLNKMMIYTGTTLL